MPRTAAFCMLLAAISGAAACRKDHRPEQWKEKSEESIDLFDQGRYLEALQPALQAQQLAQEVFGPADIRTAYSLDQSGKVYRRNGDLEKARPLFDSALKAASGVLAADDAKRAHFYDNLAELLMVEGRFDEAEDYYQSSLHVLQKNFGELSGAVASAYAKLGALYTRWGVYEEADRTLRRGEAIGFRVGGADDSAEALAAASLCEVGMETAEGQFYGQDHCRRALSLSRKLPKNHLDLAQALRLDGTLALREGRLNEAGASLQQAIDIYKLSPGADPQGLRQSWLAMAEVYAAQGRGDEAAALYQKLLPQDPNPYTGVKSALRAAAFYHRRGELKTAESLCLQALAKQVQAPKADQRDREELLLSLAEVSAGLGRNEKAEGFFRRALEVNEGRHHGPDPSTLSIWEGLARVYVARGKPDLVEMCLKRMRQVGEMFGRQHPVHKDALRRMAKVYRAMGRKQRAEKLERDADFGSG
ncbi:MAG: tetratricopeptide repeat protein [Elusimicrobia bacterium]|nr:tetratricopeptide repeat protein [Elusimicrobiota bacterium]